MESNTDYADAMKTPRRKLSAAQLEPFSEGKRSARKTILLEIPETESTSGNTYPVTPSRTTRAMDFRTPSRSDALAGAQTPRRSVRKSIKPVQEYENIVAQKGLCAKRAASSSIELEQDPVEGKWAPAVIGRASTRRNKKARRAKNKQLQRQKRIAEAEVNVEKGTDDGNLLEADNQKQSDVVVCNDESPQVEVLLPIDDKLNVVNEEKPCNDDKPEVEENTLDDNASGNDDKPQKLDEKLNVEENMHDNENIIVQEEPCNDEKPEEEEKTLVDKATLENAIGNDDKLQNLDFEENVSKEIPTCEVHSDENSEEDSDESMEGGDTEMATMPVTADDSMEGSENLIHLSEKSLHQSFTAVKAPDSPSQDDDSDCIMISLNESAEQITESKKLLEESNHDYCDSIENSMPPLVLCSDDEEEEGEVVAIESANRPEETQDVQVIGTPKEKAKQNSPEEEPSAPNNDLITPLNGTFELSESPTKDTDTEPITPQTPILRSSISRIPTPFKSNKVIIPDKIIEPDDEMDSDEIPYVLMEAAREITLKSSRKRSFSFSIDRPKKVVTFYSPTNAAVSIYDGDLMESSSKEEFKNITQRRKRSLSVTETEKEVIAYFEQKVTIENTPDKRKKLPQPTSRTKMPNFNAIHQQQFKRMESISDHVARKAERAKILSTSKVKPASIQKGLPVKNSFLRDAVGNKSKPKARQRIELSAVEHKSRLDVNKSLHVGMKLNSKSKPDLSTLDDFPSIAKLPPKMNASTACVFTASFRPMHLPKPMFDTTINAINAPLNSGKIVDRRRRNMDMYKSRNEPRSTGEKNKEILKGVRTNRRFELQMMCRNRPQQ